ncbi:hypothetical protein CDL15_Pgr026703 [Punica granatum]|uniref:Protein kinase domain-containing protein n=1 Tax=Punica granatum TaxID=22663 RepID=A0A218WL97_PUNGR|nr:hypothetical protein CDL15_Pgr026703 [Punica granatum]
MAAFIADADNGVDRLIRKIHSCLHRSPPPGPVSFVRRFSYKDIKKATDGFCRIIYSSAHGAAYKAKFRDDPLRTPLNWKTRRQIAVGVAAALEYLLLFNDPPIYHVSISSSNIMLDEDFTAKLSDVGFLGSSGNSTNAPHTKCSEDRTGSQCNNIIFQLGVLILELITGQSSEEGGFDLIQWVQENRLGGSVHNLIDPDLGSDYSSRELENLLDVARACIRSRDKPVFSAAKLLRYLQKKIDTPT